MGVHDFAPSQTASQVESGCHQGQTAKGVAGFVAIVFRSGPQAHQPTIPICFLCQQLLKRLGAPASFPPNRLRHIWVDERLSLDRAEGPEDKHACMVMGNSIQAWQKHYDLSYNIRNSQQGVDRTAVWRRAMLDRSAQGEDVVVDVD